MIPLRFGDDDTEPEENGGTGFKTSSTATASKRARVDPPAPRAHFVAPPRPAHDVLLLSDDAVEVAYSVSSAALRTTCTFFDDLWREALVSPLASRDTRDGKLVLRAGASAAALDVLLPLIAGAPLAAQSQNLATAWDVAATRCGRGRDSVELVQCLLEAYATADRFLADGAKDALLKCLLKWARRRRADSCAC